MRFFKLVQGELRKIILRPSIFILVGLLVLIVTINGFLYNPTNRTETTTRLTGSSVSEIVGKFNGTGSNTKEYFLDKVTNSNNGVNSFIVNINSTNNVKSTLSDMCVELETILDGYCSSINSGNTTNMMAYVNELLTKVTQLESSYRTYVDASKPQMLVVTDKHLNVVSNLSDCKNLLSELNNASPAESHSFVYASFTTQKYLSKIKNIVDNATYVNISENVKTEIQAYYNQALERLAVLSSEIDALENSTKSTDINNAKTKIAKYIDVTNQVKNAVSDIYYLNIADNLSSYYGYSDFNKYKTQEECTKNIYLLTNNSYSFNYADSFNLFATSNKNTTAFDFMFTSLQYFMFVIIVFAIIISSTSIGGEFSSGTIKLLLTRPFSRRKILLSKILATTIFATFFIFISMLVSLIIGGIMFGFNSLPILCVFNAESAFVIQPMVLTLILFVCLVFKAVIYINLGVLVSALFKNGIGSIVLTMFIYFAGLISNLFFGQMAWFKYLPFSHFDLFNYFSPQIAGVQFANIFVSGLTQSSIWISIGYSCAILVALTIISFEVFRKSDI